MAATLQITSTMDLQEQLIESSNRHKKGAGKFSIASLAVHGVIIAFVLFMSATASHRVDAEDKPMRVFMSSHAAPPPPPPPPPPPRPPGAARVASRNPGENRSKFPLPHP